jgi:hypothetical protein
MSFDAVPGTKKLFLLLTQHQEPLFHNVFRLVACRGEARDLARSATKTRAGDRIMMADARGSFLCSTGSRATHAAAQGWTLV